MKIDNLVPNRITSLDTTQKKTIAKSDKNTPSNTNQSGNAFSVKISAALEQMKASSSLENDDIRRDRVAAIRSQLATGTYNISGKDVASKILDAIK